MFYLFKCLSVTTKRERPLCALRCHRPLTFAIGVGNSHDRVIQPVQPVIERQILSNGEFLNPSRGYGIGRMIFRNWNSLRNAVHRSSGREKDDLLHPSFPCRFQQMERGYHIRGDIICRVFIPVLRECGTYGVNDIVHALHNLPHLGLIRKVALGSIQYHLSRAGHSLCRHTASQRP